MTAPAAAPMAASRFVCFSTVPPVDRVVAVLVPCREPLLEVERCDRVTSPPDAFGRVTLGEEAKPAALRSAALRLSNERNPRCCAANERSPFRVVSADLFDPRLHAAVAASTPVRV
jgi:hypothetical protein